MAKENKSLHFAGEQPAKICVTASATPCHAAHCFPASLPWCVAAQISQISTSLTFVQIGGAAFAHRFAPLTAAYGRASIVARSTTFANAENLIAHLVQPAYLCGLFCVCHAIAQVQGAAKLVQNLAVTPLRRTWRAEIGRPRFTKLRVSRQLSQASTSASIL